jgi:hypothetical protein
MVSRSRAIRERRPIAMTRLWYCGALMLIAVIEAHAYHVGEKPPGERRSASLPRITFVGTDRVEFSTPIDGEVTLGVYDIRGDVILNEGMASQTIDPIDGRGSFHLMLEAIPSGVFFITLRNSAGITAVGVAELH